MSKWLSFEERTERRGDCLIWTGPTSGGRYGIHRGKRAHHIAFERAHGPIPPGLKVLHECDTPLCVEGSHLFAGTQADNIHDMIAKGRAYRGEWTPERRAKLSRANRGKRLPERTRAKMRVAQSQRRARERSLT